jgi:Tol biopolymer transport system component
MIRRLALAVPLSLALCATAHAAFPGGNGRIAFTREPAQGQPDTPAQIFAVNADQSAFGPITGAVDSEEPAWSPDGRRIAYDAPDPANMDRGRIFVANADGSAPHELAPLPDASDFQPSWSPDGSRVAFVRQTYSGSTITSQDVEIANADGSGSAAPVPGTGEDVVPAWSPDGSRFALAHYTGGTPIYVIQVIGADGSNPQTIDTPPSDRMDGDPAWSPDGQIVWFERSLPAPGCFSQSQIYAVAAGAPETAAPVSLDPSLSDYQPAPSPDGTRIAFVRCDDETNLIHHVYTMNTNGTGVAPATSGGTIDDYFPDWQPAVPQFATPPAISGKGVNNQTLTAAAGSTSGGGSVALQFLRCDAQGAACSPIPGASASRAHAAASSVNYKLGSVDIGHAIRVRQTATNGLGSNSIDSSPTTSIVPSPGRCSNRFAGTAKADRLRGSRGSDRLTGGRGRDRLSGLGGADCIAGGAGNDVLSGGKGNDTLSGGAGNDRITAGSGRNRVSGGSGNDRINVRNHKRDVVNCGKGKKDRVVADRTDRLRGCERIRRTRQRANTHTSVQ